MKDPEEKEIMAYIAGLIDGDGHIGIRKVSGGLKPLVQLHNSIRDMPEYLKRIFDGTVAFDKPKKEGNRTVWKWMLQGREGCGRFLEKIAQHLVLKKDSAEEVLQFLNSPVQGKDYYQSSRNLNLERKIEKVDVDSIPRGINEDSFFWAYVAGIMDTDGSFSIERATRKPTNDNRQRKDLIKYRPKILLTMVSEGSIRFILENCPFGNLHVIKANTALRGSAFRFCISARGEAIEFLKRCIPYLQTKAIQAVKLLHFCRAYVPTNGLAKVPENEIEFREDCYKEIVRLNNTPS